MREARKRVHILLIIARFNRALIKRKYILLEKIKKTAVMRADAKNLWYNRLRGAYENSAC